MTRSQLARNAHPLAVYLDLDGTLLNSDRQMHAATVATLHALVDRGMHVGLATGRMYRSAARHARAIRANAPLVLFNGARVVDPTDGRVLHERRLTLAAARTALQTAYDLTAHVNLYDGETLCIDRITPTAEQSMTKDGVRAEPVGDLRRWLHGDITKLLLIAEDPVLDRLERVLEPRLRGRAVLVRPEPTYLEVLPPGVSKGAALEQIARILDISRNAMVAFGDGPNDLEMVEVAGMGIAMGNAHPTLQAVADEVIGHHDTDAIAHALRRIFALDEPAMEGPPT